MRNRLFLIAPLLFLAAACTTTPLPTDMPPPHFTSGTPVTLDVGRIDIVEEYHSPGHLPNVEHLFAYTPAQVFKTWVGDHIKAAGGKNILEVTIKDAGVTETKLPLTKGIEGFFTREQGARYDGKLTVEMRIFTPDAAMSAAQININASRSSTLVENATLQQRDRLFYDLTLDLVHTVSGQFDQDVRQYFSSYLK